jgi:hypothetical protein
MSDPARAWTGAIAGLLAAVICCAAPLLVAAGASLGAGGLLASGSYLLVPVLVVAAVLALVGLYHFRRRATAEPCCHDGAFNKDVKQ